MRHKKRKKSNCNAVAAEICGRYHIYILYLRYIEWMLRERERDSPPGFGLQFTTSSGAGCGAEAHCTRRWLWLRASILAWASCGSGSSSGYWLQVRVELCFLLYSDGHAREQQAAATHKLLPLVRQVTKNRTLNLAWLGSNWFAMGMVWYGMVSYGSR